MIIFYEFNCVIVIEGVEKFCGYDYWFIFDCNEVVFWVLVVLVIDGEIFVGGVK